LHHTVFVSITATQSKQNKSASIRLETTFSILTSEDITIPLDEDTIRLFSDLFYVVWCQTIAMLNIRCYQSIFTDNYLSKRSIMEFYEFLKENQSPNI